MGQARQKVNFPGVDVRNSSIRLQFTTEDGKRHKKTFKIVGQPAQPTTGNVKAAMKAVADIKHEIKIGTFSMSRHFPDDAEVVAAAEAAKDKQRTVGEQLTHYLSIADIEASTMKGYESAAKFWRRAKRAKDSDVTVGDTPIDELLYSHVQHAITAFEGTGKTINNYLSVLTKALKVAVLDKMLEVNVAANEELRSEHQEPEPDPFDVPEVTRIVEHMREHYPEPIYNLVDTWAHTGLRTSEIYGALWKAVDWNKKTILIHRANVRGVEKESTKTKRTRNLPLNSKALAALKRQKPYTLLADRHIFEDPRYGAPWDDERAFRRSYWTPTLKALGIRYRSPYQLRHTFATMLLMAGVTPAAAARIMGHSVAIFLTRYALWIDGDLNEVQNQRLEAFFKGAPAEEKGEGGSGLTPG